jgi:tRNA modification GTPase
MSETIFALSSGGGPAGLAVIRVSGPESRDLLAAMTGREAFEPRRAVRVAVRDPATGEIIDDGLALWFPGPGSYTGEDVAEFHIHGGPAVIEAVLRVMGTWPGLRLAEPGEFTRRAFQNDKLDLAEAEGLIDLIEAETEAQRRQALRQARGALGELQAVWRARLVRALAHLEAVIDFPDEEIPNSVNTQIKMDISWLADQITQYIERSKVGERVRSGIRVAIVGPPNAGKSSLLNLLARRDAAIVAETAGTTRDVIEVEMDVGGFPVVLADTAGLRETGEAVEAEGVQRARSWAEGADIKIAVFDVREGVDGDVVDSQTFVVFNKMDLCEKSIDWCGSGLGVFRISVKTGAGIGALLDALAGVVRARFETAGAPVFTRARHRTALEGCLAALRRAADAALPELMAEDLRLAVRSLGRITGEVDVEDLLDIIFSEFCIGK